MVGPMRTDEELMVAYAAGEEAALRELWERYAGLVLRVARRNLPTEDDARDLVQQTFLHVHRARRDFRPGAPFRPWLFTIALNLRREHYRRRARKPESPLDFAPGQEPSVAPPDPAAGDTRDRVRRALDNLPPAQREVIVLHWFEGFSFKEIAVMVGARVSAVKTRAHRGYNVLRKALADFDGNRGRVTGIQHGRQGS